MISIWTNLTIAQSIVIASVAIGVSWVIVEITSYESDKEKE